jgi:hypothetical protein
MSLTRAFLEITEGPGKGRRILLREGQVRYVGRTSQADDSCPENATMSSVHFSARWFAGKCELKDLNSANGTFRNEKRVTETLLSSGDEFKAGKATFRLVIDDGTGTIAPMALETVHESHADATLPPSAAPAPAPSAAAEPTLSVVATGLAITHAARLPATAQISDEGRAMLVDDMPVPQFIELLASREAYLDALRVVAHSVAKRSAVEWACRCVRSAIGDDLSPIDENAIKAAEAWAADPSEEHRRQAQAAAEAAEHKTPGAWTAMAAFWSSGSMGPTTTPAVPPPDHLTAHAAAGAVMLAAVAKQPEKAAEKYQVFLEIGKEIMNGKQPRA